ncbi:Hsp20/alpha crystallin family protein [Adhaeribacter sp. BT258]|uniref:Hsp20/alpha crystallin family protein n=1 Tax=Adhaeribacter terrigena TaxID=2793070 RepID=A0ABS1C2U4_9BACT|nr:Hsp20/alpha crystallin family protein [Adhaeribacter terrigena]MBK0403643.1 Hsp20/alpha crystallin family protein [Adhaeribacter terrigena]
MKLFKDKKFLQTIARQIDIWNTLGGGVVRTEVEIEKRKKGAIIHVSAPSVNPEAFQIQLNQNKLIVFAILPGNENNELQIPLFYQEFIMPQHVALDRIKAVYEGGELQVRLPYLENHIRQIDIEFE